MDSLSMAPILTWTPPRNKRTLGFDPQLSWGVSPQPPLFSTECRATVPGGETATFYKERPLVRNPVARPEYIVCSLSSSVETPSLVNYVPPCCWYQPCCC